MIIIPISLLLSIAIVLESVGAWFRYVGSVNSEPTNGYSSHVRIATASRLFIVVGAPMVGYAVDSGTSYKVLANIGVYVFILTAILLHIYKTPGKSIWLAYGVLNGRGVETHPLSFDKSNYLTTRSAKFQLASIISYIFTASGILVVNILAATLPEIRATILQMSAFITMFGTLIHTFYVDTKLSISADRDPNETYQLINQFIAGRFWGSIFLAAIFSIISIS